MKEERFTHGKWAKYPTLLIIDNEKGKEYDTTDICKVLNEQHEIIQQLKIQLQNTSDQRDEFFRGARENSNDLKLYENKVKKVLQGHYYFARNKKNSCKEEDLICFHCYRLLKASIEEIAKELGIDLND